MKYYYEGFELNFDLIHNDDVAKAINELSYDPLETSVRDLSEMEQYIWWNPLGNYIQWNDGGISSYYITRKYLRVNGWDLHNPDEIERCLNFLSQFAHRIAI